MHPSWHSRCRPPTSFRSPSAIPCNQPTCPCVLKNTMAIGASLSPWPPKQTSPPSQASSTSLPTIASLRPSPAQPTAAKRSVSIRRKSQSISSLRTVRSIPFNSGILILRTSTSTPCWMEDKASRCSRRCFPPAPANRSTTCATAPSCISRPTRPPRST
jgi:hypothetical protein